MGVPLDPPRRPDPPAVQVRPGLSPRDVARTVLVVVCVAIALYVIYNIAAAAVSVIVVPGA